MKRPIKRLVELQVAQIDKVHTLKKKINRLEMGAALKKLATIPSLMDGRFGGNPPMTETGHVG